MADERCPECLGTDGQHQTVYVKAKGLPAEEHPCLATQPQQQPPPQRMWQEEMPTERVARVVIRDGEVQVEPAQQPPPQQEPLTPLAQDRRVKVLRVTAELLVEMTKQGEPITVSWQGMPEDARPVAAHIDAKDLLTICILVQSDTFPEVPQGGALEDITPRATRHYAGFAFEDNAGS